MQALRRRTANAIAQVERRQKLEYKKKNALLHRERLFIQRQRNDIQRQNGALVKQELWEKWNLGELRSRKGWLSEQQRTMPREMAPSKGERRRAQRMKVLQERLQRAGEALLVEREERRKSPEYNVVRGDRIVIRAIDGPCARYRGEIGTVIGVNRQKKVCVVEGMTIRQARAPKAAPLYTLFSEPSIDPEHHVLLPIPFSQIRIIKTVINGAGEKEDVILGRLAPEDLLHMGRTYEAEQIRARQVASSRRTAAKAAQDTASSEEESEDQKLAREQSNPDSDIYKKKKEPGPFTKLFNRVTGRKPEEKKKKKGTEELEVEDPTTDSDTPRIDRDDPTWTPTLLRAPLPGTVIDELRGKYSKFRTRHDPEFLKRMQQIDSAKLNYERWAKSGAGVLDTPRKEAVLRAQAKKKDEMLKRGGLDEKALEGIGRLMWERGIRLNPLQEMEIARRAAKAQRTLPKDSIAGVVAPQSGEEALRKELPEADTR